jgi:hypothetical protein
MKTIRRIIKGCGYLPDMGEHPGTVWLIMFVLMGGMAGAERGGWKGFIGGCLFISVFMVPLYLSGAHGRAVDQERMDEKKIA